MFSDSGESRGQSFAVYHGPRVYRIASVSTQSPWSHMRNQGFLSFLLRRTHIRPAGSPGEKAVIPSCSPHLMVGHRYHPPRSPRKYVCSFVTISLRPSRALDRRRDASPEVECPLGRSGGLPGVGRSLVVRGVPSSGQAPERRFRCPCMKTSKEAEAKHDEESAIPSGRERGH